MCGPGQTVGVMVTVCRGSNAFAIDTVVGSLVFVSNRLNDERNDDVVFCFSPPSCCRERSNSTQTQDSSVACCVKKKVVVMHFFFLQSSDNIPQPLRFYNSSVRRFVILSYQIQVKNHIVLLFHFRTSVWWSVRQCAEV